jgi:hypothetical protein
MFEQKQRLRELVEYLIPVPQRREVTVTIDELVTNAVNGAGTQPAEVTLVTNGDRRRSEPIA